MAVPDEANTMVRYYRRTDYGTIAYAPTVGPIYSKERQTQFVGDVLPEWIGTVEFVAARRPPPVQ